MNSQTYTELPEVGDDRVRHSRPSAEYAAGPKPRAYAPARCVRCNAALSQYNSVTACGPCKIAATERVQCDYPNLSLHLVEAKALKLLGAKKRKPLTRRRRNRRIAKASAK